MASAGWIFVSASTTDDQRVHDLVEALRARGLDVRCDRDILKLGSRWENELRRALDESNAVLVVWSAASASSTSVAQEAALAAALDKLVPVTLDGYSVIPAEYTQLYAFDLSGWKGEPDDRRIADLAEALQNRLGERLGERSPARSVDRLSSSVKAIRMQLGAASRVPALAIVRELQRVHPEYGQGRLGPLLLPPDSGDTRQVDDWLRLVAEKLNSTTLLGSDDSINGRLVVVTLATLDETVRAALGEEVLDAIYEELNASRGEHGLPPPGRDGLAVKPVAPTRLALVREFPSGAPVAAVAIGELDGHPIAVAGNEDATVQVWDLTSSEPDDRSLTGHSGPVWAIALGLLDGRVIAVSASDDRTLRVWDLANGSPVGAPLTGHTHWVNSVAVASSPDGRTVVVSGSRDQTVRIWDLERGQVLQTLTGHTDSVSSVATGVLPDGRTVVVSGSSDQTVRIWDLERGQMLQTLVGHIGRVRTVTLGVFDRRRVVVSGGNDHTVRVWDLEGDEPQLLALGEHIGPVRTVAVGVLQGRSIVVSGGDDHAVRVWNPTEEAVQRDQVEWLSDAPADQDFLRRRPLAQALATRLRRIHAEEPNTSFLIHIDGSWGTGKSTLLNFLRRELELDWATVDFDAWRQSRIGPPWWSLLAALRQGLGHNLGLVARTRLRVIESWVRLRRAGALFVLALTLLLTVASAMFLLLRPPELTLNTVNDFVRTLTAAVTALGMLWAGALVAGRFLLWDSARGARLFEQSNTNPMQDVADHFSWLVAKIERPVVFFIDDLDRCAESYVVELLDAVQTLIRDANKGQTHRSGKTTNAACFVIAADGAWIRKSYEIAYEEFTQSVAEPGRPLGYLFLDKLFQLRVPVPSIDAPRQQEYLRELLRVRAPDQILQSLAVEEKAVRDSLRQSSTEAEVVETLRRASAEVRDRVAGTAVEKLTTPEVAAAMEHSLQRFGPLLTSNPRSMKRFVNTYSVLRAVRTLENNPVRSEPLALWTIIETWWPSLADHLRTRPEAIKLVGKPAAELDAIPADLRSLFSDPTVRRLAQFEHGGPLTPELIRACCGAEPPKSSQHEDTASPKTE